MIPLLSEPQLTAHCHPLGCSELVAHASQVLHKPDEG